MQVKSGRTLFLISVTAGILSWVLNAFFERFVYEGPGRPLFDRLINVPPEELYDRAITFLVFLVLGIVIAGLYDRRRAAEERLEFLAAELERSNRELERFAAMVSHDLKEPLVTVGGFLARLRRRHARDLDADGYDCVRHAAEGVSRMERLIGELLDYARVETRRRPLEAFDSSAALDAAVKNLAGPLQARRARLTRDTLPRIVADPIQIGQIFQNLLSNAVKFCRKETPCVHVSAARRGQEFVFSVRDNGIGIAPERTAEIFAPFRRLHEEDEFPGTGLGLATCARIAERHCGRMWVDSKPGEGSTFYFTIPATGPATSADPSERPSTRRPPSPRRTSPS